MTRSRDFIVTAIFDPGYDEWVVVEVWHDGNPRELCRFSSEDEADDFAAAWQRQMDENNSQFGVGA
jgi:hypothetical protein